MTKGWRYEPSRHSLAARGVKTTMKSRAVTQRSCLERVKEHFEGRMEDLHKLWAAYQEDSNDSIYDYGLSFDYVAPGTFADQEHGFFRYQLSCGGPQDEFRFFVDADMKPYKIEYWFLDWFDGAKKYPRGEDKELLLEIFDWFKDTGTVKQKYEEATED